MAMFLRTLPRLTAGAALVCALAFVVQTALWWRHLIEITTPLLPVVSPLERALGRYEPARERLRSIRNLRYTSDAHLKAGADPTAERLTEASQRQLVAQYALAPIVLWPGPVTYPVLAELNDPSLLDEALRLTSTRTSEDLGNGLYLLR